MQEKAAGPIRVAVLGGGCAALTAAFELTRPEQQGRYAVTVYQMGWRLGGKGASGRGPAGRIEEHGLHLWMGFYENAFDLMRACYAELGRAPGSAPIVTWQDAFSPAPVVAVAERVASGGWEPWVAHFPPGEGLPGDGMTEQKSFTVQGYLQRTVALLAELLRSAMPHGADRGIPTSALAYVSLAGAAGIFEAVDLLRAGLRALGGGEPGADSTVLRLVEGLAKAARGVLDKLLESDVALRRTWQVIDLVLAILRGSVRFGLALDPRGFDAIDDYDWREWLVLNGAAPSSVDSAFVRGIYDLTFAFVNGDPQRPSLSAGVALRGAMRMFFTYRGSLFWRMGAGMGDVVFAPLYEVLRRRGVDFRFFHRLRELELSDPSEPGTPYVTGISLDIQANVKGDRYEPLVPIHGLPCWPSQPNYDQLEEGEQLKAEARAFESPWEFRVAGERVLRVGVDFDFVVFGLGVATVPTTCRQLVERSARWKAMTENVKSVATQALQIWLRDDMRSLGWTAPPVNLSSWVEPFDTWADMTHLLPVEDWKEPVRAIAYFCSPLPEETTSQDDAGHAEVHAAVRASAIRFLSRDVGTLWPGAVADGDFRWSLLAAETPPGEHPIDGQFWTGNVRPSDRYTLSLPGSTRFRISPLDMSFDNLTIAGDWTQSGLDSGCVESAVMSGKLASHALSQKPALSSILGYDHP